MSTTREALAEAQCALSLMHSYGHCNGDECGQDVAQVRAGKALEMVSAALAQSDAQPVAWRAKSVHGWVYDERPGGMGLVWRPLVEPSIGGRCASGDSPHAKPEPQRFPSSSEQPRAAGLNQCAASPQKAQPTRERLSDEDIQAAVFAVLRSHNDDRLWSALTYEKGPYDVTFPSLALLDIGRAIERLVRGEGAV